MLRNLHGGRNARARVSARSNGKRPAPRHTRCAGLFAFPATSRSDAGDQLSFFLSSLSLWAWISSTAIVLPSSLTLPATWTFVASLSSLCSSRYFLASSWPFSSNLIHFSPLVTPRPESAHLRAHEAGCLAAASSFLSLPHLASIRMPSTPSCSSASTLAPPNARPAAATAAIRNFRMMWLLFPKGNVFVGVSPPTGGKCYLRYTP